METLSGSVREDRATRLTGRGAVPIFARLCGGLPARPSYGTRKMKVVNSLKTAKLREKGCRVVRRRGRVYVINKRNPRFKARQG